MGAHLAAELSGPPAISRRVAASVTVQGLAALIIASAFAVSRANISGARSIYWSGELLLVAPVVLIVFGEPISRAGGAIVAGTTGAASFIIATCYQPFYFTFGDEYQHYETLRNILQSGHLFTRNTVLPISSEFPGLEIMTSALEEVSHLPIVASGSTVLGLAHIVTALAVYEIGTTALRSAQGGAVTVLIYSLGPHYQVFDSYFSYTGVGLMFAFWAVAFALRAVDSESGTWRRMSAASICCGAACVVCHHVSAVFAILSIGVIAITVGVTQSVRRARAALLAMLAVTGMLGLWCGTVGTDVVSYFGPVVRTALGFPAEPEKAGPPATPPRLRLPLLSASARAGSTVTSRSIEYLGTLVLLGLCTVALLAFFRSSRYGHSRLPSRRLAPFAIGSLGLYLTVAVRLFVGDGVELAGRLFSYILLPVAVLVGALTVGWARDKQGGSDRRKRVWDSLVIKYLCAGAAFGLIWASSIIGGWPPVYAQLPGAARTAAWDRSTDPSVLLAASWASKHLPPHRYFISDQMTGAIFAGLGDETEVYGIEAQVFLASRMSKPVMSLLQSHDISYIVVNREVTMQLPSDGQYFAEDPYAGRYLSPLPKSDIEKFLVWPGGSVIFSEQSVSIVAINA